MRMRLTHIIYGVVHQLELFLFIIPCPSSILDLGLPTCPCAHDVTNGDALRRGNQGSRITLLHLSPPSIQATVRFGESFSKTSPRLPRLPRLASPTRNDDPISRTAESLAGFASSRDHEYDIQIIAGSHLHAVWSRPTAPQEERVDQETLT